MNISKNIAPYLILLSIVGYILNILFHRYLTFHLSADLYGDFAIGLNILEIVSTVLLLGTEISVVQFIPLFEASNKEDIFIKWNFYFLRKVFIFYLFLIVIVTLFFNFVESKFTGFIDSIHLAMIMLLAAPFSAFYALFLSYLNSKNYQLYSAFIDSVLRYSLLLLIFILIFSVQNIKADIDVITTVYCFAYFILGLIALKIFNSKNNSIKPFKLLFFEEKYVYEKDRKWESSSISYAFASIIFLFFMYIDKIILEIVHPNEELIGHYSVLIVLIGLFTLITRSFTPVLAPNISSYTKDKKSKLQLQSLINKTNIYVFLLTLALFLVYIFKGEMILSFYGKNGEYKAVYLAFIYLSISQIFLELGRQSLRFLLYSGFAKYINKVIVLSILILMFLGVLLTYFFGLYGIVCAHLITSFIYMMLFIQKVKKEFSDIKVFTVY